MTTEKQHPLARGYEVVPYNNGGWTVHERASPDQWSEPIGAFTDGTDLAKFLLRGHTRITLDNDARDKKELANKLKLEEQAESTALANATQISDAMRGGALASRDVVQTAILAGAQATCNVPAPIGEFRLLAFAPSIAAPNRAPGEEIADVVYGNWQAAHEAARRVVAEGNFARIFDDHCCMIAEYKP